MMHTVLWSVTILAVIVSWGCDRGKTIAALKTALRRMGKIAALFGVVMAVFAVVVSVIPEAVIQNHIGSDSGWRGAALAAVLGSVSLMPGFVAFPLGAVLRGQGVPYYVLAMFTMTLMNVGVVTFPLERRYLGVKAALVRNLAGLAVSLLAAWVMAMVFAEVGP